MSLKILLSKIREELQKREKVHEEAQRDMRRATRLSKQAILFTHQVKFKDCKPQDIPIYDGYLPQRPRGGVPLYHPVNLSLFFKHVAHYVADKAGILF
jgi:hypothetical protein